MTRARSCGHCPGSHSGAMSCLASATMKAGSWLLIEHPGPWPETVEELDDPVLAGVIATAVRMGVRPQLIRRPGRRRRTPPFQVYIGHSLGDDVWLEGREITDPAELAGLDFTELAGLDLAAVARGVRPGFGVPVTEPLLLVCTHGRHNACCARTGAPLARGLSRQFGDAVWETTHVGGDRFAANLVCLPHGLYYGDLGSAEAATAADAYLRGEIVLDRFRGRAGLPEPAQAAEHFVREHTGVLDVGAVCVESVTGTAPFEAVVLVGTTRYRVVVEPVEAAHPCGPECKENLGSYRVSQLTLLNEAALV